MHLPCQRKILLEKVSYVFDPSLTSSLRLVGTLIETTHSRATLENVEIDDIRERLEEAKGLLVAAEGIPDGVRTYALGLVREALSALEDSRIGAGVRARRLSAQLSTEMLATVDHLPPESRGTWFRAALKLVAIPGAAFLSRLGSEQAMNVMEAIEKSPS